MLVPNLQVEGQVEVVDHLVELPNQLEEDLVQATDHLVEAPDFQEEDLGADHLAEAPDLQVEDLVADHLMEGRLVEIPDQQEEDLVEVILFLSFQFSVRKKMTYYPDTNQTLCMGLLGEGVEEQETILEAFLIIRNGKMKS